MTFLKLSFFYSTKHMEPYITWIYLADKTTGWYRNYFNVEYKHQYEEKNKKWYVDFDRVGNIKILDKNEEIYQVDSDFYQN